MGVVSPGACCCDGGGECLCDVYGWYTYYPHTFDGGPGGRMVASPGLLDTQDEPYQAHGCITKSYGDGPFGHELKFEWFGWPGFQYGCTRVYSADGDLVDTVYPMLGPWGTTVANRATAPLYALADSIPQPTLDVDIEVEENLVPPAVAGHYTFDDVNYGGGKKYYIYETDYPDPYPDKLTELVAVSLNRNDGFVLKSWTGNCAYYDAAGTYLGMLPESLPEDPDDWITGDTIYVKCLKAQETQTASAMTDMAVLAGASMPPMDCVMVPGDGSLTAQVATGRAIVIKGVRAECPAAGDVNRALYHLSYRVSPEIYLEPRKEDVVDYIDEKEACIFYFDGHGGTVDGGQTLGIIPYSPESPTEREYWLTPDDVAPVNQYAYKLAMFSTCAQAKIDLGQPWKDAFNAEAVIAWDEKTWPSVSRAYDLAFFECFNPSDPAKYRKNAEGAHDYALTIAQEQPRWKQPWEKKDEDGNIIEIVPILGEPRCNGDTIIIPPWKRRFDLE